MIDQDSNVELAIATEFVNGNKSVLKDELNNCGNAIIGARLVLAVVEELEAMSDKGADDVQTYLEAL